MSDTNPKNQFLEQILNKKPKYKILPMNFREHIKQLKEQPETAAAGTKWTAIEETQLIDSLSNGKDIDDIAKEHKRTVGGIKSRMKEIAVRMLDNNETSIEEVCKKLRLTSEEIEDAQKRRAAVSNKQHASNSKIETELDVLKDIRELLIRIEKKIIKD